MKIKTLKNQTIFYDPKLCPEISEGLDYFDHTYWQAKNAITGSAKGRGITWFIALGNIEGALKHYHRGGLFGKIIHDHYLFLNWKNTRALKEFALLEYLIQSNVNVPRPIAARACRNFFFYQADLITEKIPFADDLVKLLQKKQLPSEVYISIGKEIRKMHNAQVCHTDLNSHNILLDRKNNIWVIDFDKCGIKDGDDWKTANLNRLKRSFLKEVQKHNINWQLSDWNDLIKGYNKFQN